MFEPKSRQLDAMGMWMAMSGEARGTGQGSSNLSMYNFISRTGRLQGGLPPLEGYLLQTNVIRIQ